MRLIFVIALGTWFSLSLFADEPTQPVESELDAASPAKAAAAAPTTAPAPAVKEWSGPQLAIKKRIEELFEASKKVNGPEKTKARGTIETALDWDRIARDCLGTENWKKQNKTNQLAFQNLLKDVVTKTAFSRMDTFWSSTTYNFEKIDVTGGEGHVACKFKVKDDSFQLDYYLHKKGANWIIHDIAFEELRYSSNINEQLTAFLKEKPFSALLDKLKKRREELQSGSSKSTKKG